jgi:hypothetical protein
MIAILGYARVSTTGQDLDTGGAERRRCRAPRVFSDKLSGSAKTIRPGLAAMLDYARAGDTLVVTANIASILYAAPKHRSRHITRPLVPASLRSSARAVSRR